MQTDFHFCCISPSFLQLNAAIKNEKARKDVPFLASEFNCMTSVPFELSATRSRAPGPSYLFDDLSQVVGCRLLQRRVRLVRLEVLQPQLLADGQHVPVVLKGGHRGGECTAQAHRRLLVDADRLLEGIALDVLDQSEVERNQRHDPAGRPGCDMV